MRVIVLVATFLLAAPCLAATVTYPGTAPCNTTLQACINGVADGTVLEIATDGPILETALNISHSLTLTAAAGFHPRIGESGGTNYGVAIITNATSTLDITVSHIELVQGGFSVGFYHGAGHQVTVRDCTVSSTLGQTINMLAEEPASFVLQGNHLSQRGVTISLATDVNVSVLGNTIETSGGHVPLLFQMTSVGTATSTIANNVLSGAGSDSALHLYKVTGGGNPYTYFVFNNTLAHAQKGIEITVSGMTVMSAEIDNNALSDMSIGIQRNGSSDEVHINATHNNIFTTSTDTGATGASGTLTVTDTTHADPLYVSAIDFHLQALSPLINAGSNTPTTGSLPLTDADGNVRIFDGVVDIGAYESGAVVAPTGTTGPSGTSGPSGSSGATDASNPPPMPTGDGTMPEDDTAPMDDAGGNHPSARGCACRSAEPSLLLALAVLLLRRRR